MKLFERAVNALSFKPAPTTILLSLIYISIFTAVLVTDEPPALPRPSRRRGLDIDQAFRDLRAVAARPHPYNSHANDDAHSYILERVKSITSGHAHAHVDNDLLSNGSWSSPLYLTYFEGTNILVKLDGTDEDYAYSGGVLFSAHYDSVSTAPGATDDGMGVVTLLQLLQHFVNHRPKRTVVFNINNGEEDWLNGAHAFINHPWSNITETFLNLEGASSGGRPMLFRATSAGPLRAFLPKNVPHPHANVLSADAFARGVIRSGTDYSVYTDAGMDGLDLAFYRGRSKYHTKFDAVPHTDGNERALWSMMEASYGAGVALANDDETHKHAGSAVYLDLFAAFLILFPLKDLFLFNILALTFGPIFLAILLVVETIIQHSRRDPQNGPMAHRQRFLTPLQDWLKEGRWLTGFWRLFKFWASLVLAVALQATLVFGYLQLNPFFAYSYPYVALLSFLSLAYLSINLVLKVRLPFLKNYQTPPEMQKETVLLQIYVLTWILLLFSTIAIKQANIGGLYFISAWNGMQLLGCIVASLEGMLSSEVARERDIYRNVRFVSEADEEEDTTLAASPESQPTPLIRPPSPIVVEPAHAPPSSTEETNEHEDATENTPLIRRPHSVERRPSIRLDRGGAVGWWILQMLLVVPIPVILVSHISLILIAALSQTLSDGGGAMTVYIAISALAFLLVLPAAPFAHKTDFRLTGFLVILFVATTTYGFLAFPFTQDSPLKVYFQQLVQLGPDAKIQTVITSLTGVDEFLASHIIPQLPSTYGKQVNCTSKNERGIPGLTTCRWETYLVPTPGGGKKGFKGMDWLSLKTSSKDGQANITISGTNTRNCRLYFDTHNVTSLSTLGTAQHGYPIPSGGVSQLRLWSRTWDRTFDVGVGLGKGDKTATGRAACEWNEYESGSIGASTGGKIPALEEALTWLPKWAVVTKSSDGLVEASQEFKIHL